MSEIIGVMQGDVIIRTALMEAIADLRRNPYLLDYAFASLKYDDLTKEAYGDKEIQKAKTWLLKTNVPIVFNLSINQPQYPCITIGLASSKEDDTTTADTHYVTHEEADLNWPELAGPTHPVSYDSTTGTIVFNADLIGGLILGVGMVLVTKTGSQHPVLEVTDVTTTVVIAADQQLDLEDVRIMPAKPSYVAAVESVNFVESYTLGCHVDSEPAHLLYLHSILVFCLLRYRETLLEGRGFERSTISSGPWQRDDADAPEFFYERAVTLTGFVRQVWPKAIVRKLTGLLVQVLPDEVAAVVPEKDLLEALEMDSLSVRFK